MSESWWNWLFGSSDKRPSPFVRNIVVARTTRLYVFGSAFTDADREAFAELLLKLDGNPVKHSALVNRTPPVPGLRWAPFAGHKAIFVFDPAHDLIRILTIEF